MKKYIVQQGDSLYKISQKTGVRIPLLLASNPSIQNPSQLMPGMSIVIPELGKKAKSSEGTTATSTKKPTVKKKKPSMPPYFGFVWPHQVAPSDTWDSIGNKYGVSVQQLQHMNPEFAQQGQVQPGHTLYVPTPGYSASAAGAQQLGDGGTSPQPMPSPTPSSQPSPGQQDLHGPHTHHPYRPGPGSHHLPPSGKWFVRDESSSFLTSQDDEFDVGSASATTARHSNGQGKALGTSGPHLRGGGEAMPSTDDNGWSDTFTVHIDDRP